jgi:RNA polymerase sigma-70 factor (ECF subfamily)
VIRKSATREKYIQRQIRQPSSVGEDFRAESELKEMIETAIGKLPPKCREIFELSRFEGLSSKEIAQKLQLSQRTVETHITHALKILRKELKDYLFHFFFIF